MKTAMQRFEEKFIPEPMSGCWLWTGSLNNKGYGQFRINYPPKKLWLAHRWLYTQLMGEIPTGLVLRHSCDTPACVNPDHLETGTNSDNVQDMLKRGRGPYANYTHCKWGHEFTEENTLQRISRPGGRECRACAKVRIARFKEKHAEQS